LRRIDLKGFGGISSSTLSRGLVYIPSSMQFTALSNPIGDDLSEGE
jgi:hypothetical protein